MMTHWWVIWYYHNWPKSGSCPGNDSSLLIQKKSLGYQKEKEIENFDNPESLSAEMSSMGQKEDKNRPWKDLSEVPRLRQSPRFRSRPENKEFPQGSNLSKEAIGKFKNLPEGQIT